MTDLGRFLSVSWQPPAQLGRTGVGVGDQQLSTLAERMRPRNRGAGVEGWALWAVPGELSFRTRRLTADCGC